MCKSRKPKIAEQVNLAQLIVDKANVNIVTCGNCGDVFLHECGKEELECPYCDFEGDIGDFPDLFYTGLEDQPHWDEPTDKED